MTFSFAVLLVVSAVQMFGGNWWIKLLIHLSNHHRRPVHKQQKDHDALCLLPGHPTRKVSAKFQQYHSIFSIHYQVQLHLEN